MANTRGSGADVSGQEVAEDQTTLPRIDLDEEYLLEVRPLEGDDALDAQPEVVPTLNKAQRFTGGATRFLKTVSGLVWGSAIALDEEAPTLPVPSDYAAPAIGAMASYDAWTALRALSSRANPLQYLELEGSGSVVKGFAMEAGKKLAAAVPAILVASGISYGRDALWNYAMQDPENNMTLMLGLSYFNTPLLRSLLITVPSLLVYWAGQRIIERAVPGMQPPMVPPEDHPDLKWYQNVLAEVMDVMSGVTLAGVGRQIFITVGPELVLHNPYALMMAPGFVLMLALLEYYSENPHPFKNVRDFVGEFGEMFSKAADEYQPVPNDDAPQAEAAPAEEHPEQSAGRIAANIGIKFGIALGAFALAALVNRRASAAISAMHPDAGGENDPSSWKTAERVGYEAALAAGMVLVQRMLENMPAAVNKLKKDGPAAAHSVGEAATTAAHAVSEAAKTAAQKTGTFFSRVGGLFSHNQSAAAQLPVVGHDEDFYAKEIDEDVVTEYCAL